MSSFPVRAELKVFGRRPSLPPEVRVYAIGDIHGRLDLLNQLLSRIQDDSARRPKARPIHVFLGDYIDRGSWSRETIDRLIEHGESQESVFLKGNHEQIAIKCLSNRGLFDQWLRLGGVETLLSYGLDPDKLLGGTPIVQLQSEFHGALPQSHLRFFRDLQNFFECGDFFFAHAGVRPGVELSRQKESDLLWIRDEFLSSSQEFGKFIVHGHTPTGDVYIGSNRINIDTGAFATGRLTCLVLEGESLSIIDTSSEE